MTSAKNKLFKKKNLGLENSFYFFVFLSGLVSPDKGFYLHREPSCRKKEEETVRAERGRGDGGGNGWATKMCSAFLECAGSLAQRVQLPRGTRSCGWWNILRERDTKNHHLSVMFFVNLPLLTLFSRCRRSAPMNWRFVARTYAIAVHHRGKVDWFEGVCDHSFV